MIDQTYDSIMWVVVDNDEDQLVELHRGGKLPVLFRTKKEAQEYRAENQKVVKVWTTIEITSVW